jgi:hypothetical protein
LLTDHAGLSPFERLLTLFTRMRPGEGRCAGLFFLHGFLLLFSYQILKALREAFMLAKFSAEIRSYAVAVIALLLMVSCRCTGWSDSVDGAKLPCGVGGSGITTILRSCVHRRQHRV